MNVVIQPKPGSAWMTYLGDRTEVLQIKVEHQRHNQLSGILTHKVHIAVRTDAFRPSADPSGAVPVEISGTNWKIEFDAYVRIQCGNRDGSRTVYFLVDQTGYTVTGSIDGDIVYPVPIMDRPTMAAYDGSIT